MKYVVFASLIALPAAGMAQTTPAAPQAPAAGATATAAAPTVGATVVGKDNQPAGTVAQVTAQAVVIDTGTNKVPVPPTAIGSGPKGPTIQMTKAELDAAFAQAAQQAQASLQLTPGKMVHGSNGAMLGTIKVADAQFVTVTTPKGDVKLPVSGFAPGPDNTVRVGTTAAELDAALGANASSQPAAQPSPAATPATAADQPAAAETTAAQPTTSKKAKKPKN